jgi:hypothetical protein
MNLSYIIKFLAFFWQKLIPIILVLGFSIGVFFHLWDVQKIPMIWSVLTTVLTGAMLVYILGKIIKLW